MESTKKLHPNSLYGGRVDQPLSTYERSNGHAGGGRRSPEPSTVSSGGQTNAPVPDEELARLRAAPAQHHPIIEAGDYHLSGLAEPEYGGLYLPPGTQYNPMGHLAVAPSQKYPHMMGDAGGYQPHYPAYSHYGTNPYGGAPQYLSEASPQIAQYMGQEYVERGRSPPSPSSRSTSPPPGLMAAPRLLPPSPNPATSHHQLQCIPQTRYDDVDPMGRLVQGDHYCGAPSPRPSLGDQYVSGAPGSGPGGGAPNQTSDDQVAQQQQLHLYGYVGGQTLPQGYSLQMPVSYKDSQNGLSLGSAGGQSMYGDELEIQKQMAEMTMGMLGVPGGVGGGGGEAPRLQWRDPNLPEVIGFLDSPSPVVKANAAAYLQHLCYMDDPNKQKTRNLGGIPPLVRLLSHESPEVCRNACGALRNLSYGRQNDENKRGIRQAGGIPALTALLCRTHEMEVKELVTGVIWNMSSCEDLKQCIIEEGAHVIVSQVIIPHSGWHATNPGDTYWSTVFRNASGVLRNVSSAGAVARRRLRALPSLAAALLHAVRAALTHASTGSKIVENCVCTLRNLSYRCQEVEDPNYDRRPDPSSDPGASASNARASANSSKGDNLGCFGGSKKKKEGQSGASSASTSPHGRAASDASEGTSDEPPAMHNLPKGTEMLWSPEVVPLYMALLQSCSNPETLEAAAGALQNLAACYWQPSIDIRAAVRKEKGLPILVELLRMEVDRVVCAVATALRNLAIDQRNKELIGKYAMRDLVQKLPGGNPQHDQGTSDDTIAAVLATLNEVIKRNAEFSRALLEASGVDRLVAITHNRTKYTPRVLKFAGQVLFTMWQHQDLRDVYRKHGWKESDFVSRGGGPTGGGGGGSSSGSRGAPGSPGGGAPGANSTLSRPMASQGGTRYEDRTIKRGTSQQRHQGDEIPMVDMTYSDNVGNPNGRAIPPGLPQPQQPPSGR